MTRFKYCAQLKHCVLCPDLHEGFWLWRDADHGLSTSILRTSPHLPSLPIALVPLGGGYILAKLISNVIPRGSIASTGLHTFQNEMAVTGKFGTHSAHSFGFDNVCIEQYDGSESQSPTCESEAASFSLRDEQALVLKADLRIVPILSILYLMAFLDRWVRYLSPSDSICICAEALKLTLVSIFPTRLHWDYLKNLSWLATSPTLR